MRILEKPSIGVSAEELFVLCARSFTNEDFRTRLLGYTDRIRRHAEENQKRVPVDIRDFLEEIRQEQVCADDMKKVYEQKLVGGVGRSYYDQIMLRAPLGHCPICGVQQVSSLDHYLPKSLIPTLAVDPGNLIPACSSCNSWKKDILEDDPGKMPVHIYYDVIPPGKWLHTELGDDLTATYYVRCPDSEEWEDGIRRRVTQHLDLYHLHKTYSNEAAEELSHLKSLWSIELEELRECAEEEVTAEELRKEFRKFIRKHRKSYERIDENSCESAFYRGLEENMETAYAFFGLKEPVCAE